MQTITFKIDGSLARRLANVPKKNRRFNTKSELLRMLVALYLDDHIVKHAIHEGMKRRYGNLIDEDLL